MKTLSLRSQIFISLIFLVLLSSVLIATVSIFQYNEQSKNYHQMRLERKESQLKKALNYVFKNSNNELFNENFYENIQEFLRPASDILNIDFYLYDLEGNLLTPFSDIKFSRLKIPKDIIESLENSPTITFIDIQNNKGERIRSSYSYIFLDGIKTPFAILNVPYYDDDSLIAVELILFRTRLIQGYAFLIIVAIIIAFLISSYVTRSLIEVGEKLNQTNFLDKNSKIQTKKTSKEITNIITAYNKMVDKLEESAIMLAKSQREAAWREMAKQVAHEIKNPLTPMRLSIQHFEKQVERGNLNLKDDFSDFTNTLMQQIDTMSSIASSFSEFATMPLAKSEKINITNVLKSALELYKENRIKFNYEEIDLFCEIDKTQLVRIVNNLISNSINACKGLNKPVISANLKYDSKWIYFNVVDNGCGVDKSLEEKIFEPTFTTSTSGMGLGLSMVKSIVTAYGGNVGFSSVPFKKTSFQIKLIRLT